jgi:hypothetical protein
MIQRANGGTIHRSVQQLANTIVEARRINKYYLVLGPCKHPQNGMPGGMWLGRDYADFCTHKCVDQSRLTNIWPSNYGYKTTFMHS